MEQGSLVCSPFRRYPSVGNCFCSRDVPYLLFARIGAVLSLFYPCTRAFAACIYPDIPAGTSYDLLYHDRDSAAPVLLDSQ